MPSLTRIRYEDQRATHLLLSAKGCTVESWLFDRDLEADADAEVKTLKAMRDGLRDLILRADPASPASTDYSGAPISYYRDDAPRCSCTGIFHTCGAEQP